MFQPISFLKKKIVSLWRLISSLEIWIVSYMKWILAGGVIFLCIVLVTLVLLQRGEEGAFKKSIAASQTADSYHLFIKTIWSFIIFVALIMAFNMNLYYAFKAAI